MTAFEDLSVGQRDSFGSCEVTKADVVEFAEAYDPQPMHTDEAAAADSMFDGLVASGWHTAALTMRMLVENVLDDSGAMGSPGVDELRWHEPVRPGDVLHVETEILETRPSSSDLDRGIVRVAVETKNQRDVTVMSMAAMVFWACETD